MGELCSCRLASEMKPLVHGLNVVYLYVRDMDAAVRFFRDLLGIQLEHSDPNWAEARLGDTRFALHEWHEGAPEPAPSGVRVSFLVDDVGTAAARLREADVEVGPIHRQEYGSHCDVVGPEGYVFQLSRPSGVTDAEN